MSAEFDPLRAITALRALDADSGGRRIAWTADWERARAWLRGELAGIPGVEERTDEAGNLWARLPGRSPDTVVLGSHLDCVPNGGWLDGALGVVAALEALRTIAADPEPPDRSVALVDWADEEGARFGHSLLGSSAAAGLLDVPAVSALRDRDGIALPDVLAAHGVAVARMPDARASLDGVIAYLELHIEQGPVLERTGRPCAAVDGCLGVRRTLVTFTGEAGHAGATPMDGRRDPVQAAVAYVPLMTAAAAGASGFATVGSLRAEPGTATAIPERCVLTLDLRHRDLGALEGLAAEAAGLAEAAAGRFGCEAAVEPLWGIDPVRFDDALVSAALEVTDGGQPLTSGPLHDAAAVARAGVPAAMIFVRSRGGVSHSRAEDSDEADLAVGLRAFWRLARVATGAA